MRSETLRNIRTMRQIRTSPEEARRHHIKTVNSLAQRESKAIASVGSSGGQLELSLVMERRRFTNFEASVEKSQLRLLKAREKLAVIINKNRALTALRHELQREHWDEKLVPPTESIVKLPSCPEKLREIELRY